MTFTGRIPDDEVAAILSTADVGISPDPKNPLNDVSTMNKTMEYMAFALPVVAFDLRETRISAGDAAVYATPNDVGELAQLLVDLIDDEPRRLRWARRDELGLSRSWRGITRLLATSRLRAAHDDSRRHRVRPRPELDLCAVSQAPTNRSTARGHQDRWADA